MTEAPPINGETRIFGVLGHPVRATLSPAMHNAAFRALGMNAVYLPFPVAPEHLEPAVRGLVASGVEGFNLTVPHKEAILPLLDEITPQARAVGAVNTVGCVGGRLSAANTDGEGLLLSLEHELDWRAARKRVLLLGAGGAARGIAFSLLEAGAAELWIANRTRARAEALGAECSREYPLAAVSVLNWGTCAGLGPDLLINSTTVGMGEVMKDRASPVELESLQVRDAVVDIVYTPPRTPLLEQADRLGLPHSNGLGMLLYQGWLGFRFWHGRDAPLEVMREALLAGLAHRKG